MDPNEKIQTLRKQAMSLPLHPGVYIMKDEKNTVIYVGKAKALKNRVSQYFGSDANHTEKVRQMVAHVDHFETILADSEFEALVLECSLIKHYSPKYNILLKDDKGYSYIRISPPPYSRITEAKSVQKDNAKYLGPYVSSYAVKQTVDEINKTFGLATCERKFTYGKKPLRTERPCLNYHIQQCCGPCNGKISPQAYEERVQQAIRLLQEGVEPLKKTLEAQMLNAADNLDFEKAADLRDRITSIERLQTRQKVVMSSIKEQDILAVAIGNGKSCVQVFHFTGGNLSDKEEYIFDIPESLESLRGEFIQRFYDGQRFPPKRIAVDGEVEDRAILEEWLSKKAGSRVSIVIPKRGEQAKLVSMCSRNASENLAKAIGSFGKDVAALDELAKALGLVAPPRYIECFDISHTAGSNPVAGMVVFKDGRPLKKAYRRFGIKEANGGDDPSSLREVISRRLNEYVVHEGEEGFGVKPDVILLDGGKAQVDAVMPIVKAMELDIPVFGLVKDGKHRTRAVSTQNGEISIKANRAVYTLLATIQEEVHRYAIGYHQKKRKTSSLETELTSIEGVGKTRSITLLKRFGSLKAIRNASKEELLMIKGITEPVAENIVRHFKEK
ncbi:MAG: excinuclease ABC subunit UvrC [Clostridia bacterium]|nr:excinuclease ABC subunit UvrC [Clostridia bacterium]